MLLDRNSWTYTASLWTQGHFQPAEMWKEAIVIPILKKEKDRHNKISYCPISLLSCLGKTMSAWWQGSHFPAVSQISAKMKFQNPRKKKQSAKKIRPNVFLKRQLKLTQTASKLQRRSDDRILHLVFALRYEISRDQLVAIVFWVKMPHSDFVRQHEAAFRDFHIFLVGAQWWTDVSSTTMKKNGLLSPLV